MDVKISVLHKVSLFSGMKDEEIMKLIECTGGRISSYNADSCIWHMGDCVAAAGIVLEGRIRAESMTPGGQRIVVTKHGECSMFGEILMSSGGYRSPVDIYSDGDCRILLMPFKGIMGGCFNSCKCHNLLRENLLKDISLKFIQLNRKVQYVSERRLRSKIGRWLLDESEDAGSNTVYSQYSREELAAYLGANRSALSRELGRMAGDGIIAYYRNSFRIVDYAKLRKEIE